MHEIKVRNYIDSAQLKVDIAINPVDLDNAFLEHAALRAHYGELAAKAAKQVDDLKIVLEAAKTKVYRELRDHYLKEKVKLTEALLERELAGDARLIKIQRAINEAKQVEGIAKAACAGFSDRKDLLVQLGAKDRKEREGELRMKIIEAGVDAAGPRALEAVKRLREG